MNKDGSITHRMKNQAESWIIVKGWVWLRLRIILEKIIFYKLLPLT